MSTDKQASPKDSEVKTREHPFLCLEDFQAANGRLYLKSHAYERIPDDSGSVDSSGHLPMKR